MTRLERITNKAIKFIQNAEELALKMDERGFHVAFSGGKDSQVLLKLVEMAGVKYHAEMQITSVDAPDVIRFVRDNYPQVKFNLPKRNMRELILQKGMLPTRQARFCCAELKEKAGAGCCICIGIRKAESSRRTKRHAVEVIGKKVGYDILGENLIEQQSWGRLIFDEDKESNVYCVGGKDKVVISPIIDWTDKDVWDFIHFHKMPYCTLYDNGWKRIGCLLCPMATTANKNREYKMFPRFADKVYKRAIRELMAQGKYKDFKDEEQVFDWYMKNMPYNEYMKKYVNVGQKLDL